MYTDCESALSTLFRKLCISLGVLKTPILSLGAEHVQHLTDLMSRGTVAVKTYRRAAALLALHQGQCYSAVGRHLGVRYDTVRAYASNCSQCTRG